MTQPSGIGSGKSNTPTFPVLWLISEAEISEITLYKELQRGLYKNCRLVYDCYSLNDKSQLNSGEVKLEINSY